MSRNRGKKARQKQSLQDLIREPFGPADTLLLRRELVEGTDRSAALVSCSLVDNTLMAAMAARMYFQVDAEFANLFMGPMAPLGSFSTRIKVGKALAIYGSQVEDMLDSIRQIRNVFAHSAKPLPFTHPTILDELDKLPPAEIHFQTEQLAIYGLDFDRMTAARARFVTVCLILVDLLKASAKLHHGKGIRIDLTDGRRSHERVPLPRISELLPRSGGRNRG
jgi:hypothetical protein